tara:strand:+ start:39190 stop:39966 length:777 start_codon:yes stop_codon:yes gene_type:complete
MQKKKDQGQLIDKSYRLLKYEPLTFTLKVGRDKNLLIFDEKLKVQRAIRHCPNEPSIFVDKQSDWAVVEPIIFIKGFVNTKKEETSTQAFLESHPKRGLLFDLVDSNAEAEDMVDIEELSIDVKQAIRDKVKDEGGIEELRAVVSVLISDVGRAAKMSPSELKFAAYDVVDTNINRFINDAGDITIFDDSNIKRRALAQHAFNSGVIQVSSDASKIIWTDNNAVICLVPVGMDYLTFFTDFLKSEEGMQVAVEITKRM